MTLTWRHNLMQNPPCWNYYMIFQLFSLFLSFWFNVNIGHGKTYCPKYLNKLNRISIKPKIKPEKGRLCVETFFFSTQSNQGREDIKFRSLNAARNHELFQVTFFCILSVGNRDWYIFSTIWITMWSRSEYTLPTIRGQPENSTVTFKDLHFSVLRKTGEADPF